MSRHRSTRRKFLKTTGSAASLAFFAAPFLEVLGGSLGDVLAAPTPYVRPNVKSSAGQSMLTWYAQGIKAMQALPSSNPLNWTNFANIHGSPSGSGPLWNTCQHGQWWFLPWHRMYLYFLEAAIRKYSNPAFALPFWDYEDPTQRALPAAFRTPATPANVLYVSARNPQINAGAQLQPSTVSTTNAMSKIPFATSASANNFGSQIVAAPSHLTSPHGALESTPHDAVHVAIGGWMGQVNLAARDPIFWLHHANIDRLWNTWLAMGGGRMDPNNTTWCNQKFTFPNTSGSQTTWPTSGVINAKTQLGYTYEGQGPTPVQVCGNIVFVPPKFIPEELLKKPEPVRLTDQPVHVSVAVPPQTKSRALEVARDPKRSTVLRVEGIDVDGPPGVIYEVYVGVPANQKAVGSTQNFVGVLAPFGAEGHGDHAEHGTFAAAFPIDAQLERALTASSNAFDVQFVPRGLLDANGKELPVQLTGHVTFKTVRLTAE